MAEIVPRWEWRTFAHRFPHADAAIEAMTPESVEESVELYFLAPGGDNVKVRDELMDIKVLREIDAAGLQRWEPILKIPFPLGAEAARTVFEGLRRPLPAIPPTGLGLDGIIAAAGLVRPAVRVRSGSTSGGLATPSLIARPSAPSSRPEGI